MQAVIVMPWDEPSVLIRWAIRFARAAKSPLTVLCHTGAKPIVPSPLQTDQPIGLEAPILKAVRKALAEYRSKDVELMEIRHVDPVQSVLQAIERKKITQLIVGGSGLASERSERWRVADRLFRFAPCDTVIIDSGETDGKTCRRVLIPFAGRLRKHVLRVGSGLSQNEGTTALPFLVGSYLGEDSEEVAMRELKLELKSMDIEISESIEPVVDVASKPREAITKKGRGCDLIVLGGDGLNILQSFRGAGQYPVARPLGGATAIAMVRPKRVTAGDFVLGGGKILLRWIPTLKPKDRVGLFDRLQEGSRMSVDYCIMLSLSAAIASFGLLQDSPAIVIGAMLVAPLMTPLIGCGLALMQGNARLFGKSVRAAGFGIFAALLLSFAIGLFTRRFEITNELSSRGTPNILDLGIAFLSGMAAAYAMARPGLMGTIAGVAIATALVPPLATMGIATAHGQWKLMMGSSKLFIANAATIILGAAAVFRLLGMTAKVRQFGPPLWIRRVLLMLVLACAVLVVPLSRNLSTRLSEGTNRSLLMPASEVIRNELTARIAKEPRVELFLLARPGGVSDRVMIVTLISARPLDDKLAEDINTIIRSRMGNDMIVEIAVVKAELRRSPPVKKTKP